MDERTVDDAGASAAARSPGSTPDTGSTPSGRTTLPPAGSAEALQHGCICSVLGNAAYRVGADPGPLIEPDCPLHGLPPR